MHQALLEMYTCELVLVNVMMYMMEGGTQYGLTRDKVERCRRRSAPISPAGSDKTAQNLLFIIFDLRCLTTVNSTFFISQVSCVGNIDKSLKTIGYYKRKRTERTTHTHTCKFGHKFVQGKATAVKIDLVTYGLGRRPLTFGGPSRESRLDHTVLLVDGERGVASAPFLPRRSAPGVASKAGASPFVGRSSAIDGIAFDSNAELSVCEVVMVGVVHRGPCAIVGLTA